MGFLDTFFELMFFEQIAIMLVVGSAIASLVYAWWLRRDVLKKDMDYESAMKYQCFTKNRSAVQNTSSRW